MGNREVRQHLIWYHALWPMLLSGSMFLVLFWLMSVFFLQPEAGKLREIGVICFGVIAVVGLIQTLLVLLRQGLRSIRVPPAAQVNPGPAPQQSPPPVRPPG